MTSLIGRVKSSQLGKRRAHWIGLIAVLVPLTVMMVAQYWWLVDLEDASSVAHKATLENYLDFVTEQIEFGYSGAAERTLDAPAEVLARDREVWLEHLKKGLDHWTPPHFRLYFVTGFRADQNKWNTIVFYDPQSKEVTTEVPLSAYFASVYWEMLSRKGETASVDGPIVDERDPENPIILRPIVDKASSKIAGVVGAIVDIGYFKNELLPKMIRKVRPKFINRADLVVSVRDGKGNEVLSNSTESDAPHETTRNFSYVFTDWKIGIAGGGWTGAQLARWNFIFNITLSVTLAAVLLLGIGLVMRTATRELNLSEMKGDFVSNVSHELRTPLSSIRAFGELMSRGKVTDPAKVQEYGEYIETEDRRLSQLIQNILDFSRIESGQKIYTIRPHDLEEVVDRVLKTFEVRLRHRGFKIAYSKSTGSLPKVPVDPDAIGHALGNLLDNAVKYSNGSKEIDVHLKSTRSGEVILAVRDRGVGIEAEEQKRIFERFHRVSTGLIHDVRGSGLGLAIVKHIVAAHGGYVTVRSELGKGSEFAIHLSVQPQVGSETAEAAGELNPEGVL